MDNSINNLYQIYLQHPSICTDNRKVKQGDLFFALKGERFDGNQFAAGAIDSGAAYAIVDDPNIAINDQYILVDDVLTTLQQLATHHRLQFNIPIIGITGSNGKTTTKELVSCVLNQSYKIHATKGNFNNHIGVPLTLLAMPLDTTLAVIEMGANKLHEIGELCAIAQPNYGLITNVGKAHLEGFGSFEGVKATKSELYHWLTDHQGVAFVNADEAHLPTLSKAVGKRQFYGSQQAFELIPRITPIVEQLFTSAQFEWKNKQYNIKSQLYGSYNFNNIMTAITLGLYFKVPAEAIKSAIEKYTPSNNRSQIKHIGNNTFVMDAYNANPVSMKKSIDSFTALPTTNQTKLPILGDMLELGEVSTIEHQNIINYLAQLDFKQVLLVGAEMNKTTIPANFKSFVNCEDLNKWLKEKQFNNHIFLLKGSRSIGLEKVLHVYEEI